MNLIEIQKQKEKPFKYLISKGFSLKTFLTPREQAPVGLLEYIGTKRIVYFSLRDRNDEEIDAIFIEYGAFESEWERMWRNLSS
jgi:hypothetical protein